MPNTKSTKSDFIASKGNYVYLPAHLVLLAQGRFVVLHSVQLEQVQQDLPVAPHCHQSPASIGQNSHTTGFIAL